jgi:hypothetical protein
MIALMMEVVSTSETLAIFYQTTWHNILEDSHLHIRCCENLKSELGLGSWEEQIFHFVAASKLALGPTNSYHVKSPSGTKQP